MNYQISEYSKKHIMQSLLDLTMIVAAIPDTILDSQMKLQQAQAIMNSQESARLLEASKTIPFIDLESDIQKN